MIHTQDVRIRDYVEPLAMRLVGFIADQRLALKEIVIVVKNGNKPAVPDDDYLRPVHQYLLIYEVKNG